MRQYKTFLFDSYKLRKQRKKSKTRTKSYAFGIDYEIFSNCNRIFKKVFIFFLKLATKKIRNFVIFDFQQLMCEDIFVLSCIQLVKFIPKNFKIRYFKNA